MKELQAILAAVEQHSDQPLALATVVRTQGSTYRRPGAMMVCLPGGETVGTISGGCLESEVAEAARSASHNGTPRLLALDMRQRQGCNGLVEVLVETLKPNVFQKLKTAQTDRRALVLATVFEMRGDARISLGTRVLTDDRNVWHGLESERTHFGRLWEASRDALQNGRSSQLVHHLGEGLAATFLRVLLPPLRLVIFGGSDDSATLAELAGSLGWEVRVAIHPATEPSSRLQKRGDLQLCAPSEVASLLNWDTRTAAVLMTHHFGRDAAFLQALLPLQPSYLGLLGPRSRRENIIQTLLADSPEFNPELLANLYGPAGLDLGAETPEQVALAIVSEIQAAMNGRSGGSLRELKTPIHVG